jgi:hypothetical protein
MFLATATSRRAREIEMRIKGLLTAIAFAISAAGITPAHAQTNVLFVFDASGSMKRDAGGGESRMVAAKRAIGDTLRNLPASARLGLMVYGHRRAKDCSDIELVSPIAAEDAASLARYVNALDAKGETPIAEALLRASKSFAAFKGQSNRIVLVTDGIEECRGDPCAAARNLAAMGLDLKVDVVGFTLNESQREVIQCVSDITGGTYYDARSTDALKRALAEVQISVSASPAPVAAAPSRFNLISKKNGGALLLAPNDGWQAANDDIEKSTGNEHVVGAQAVFAFKDEKPATFDTFTVFINASSSNNVKEIELLAGDEGPIGQFRSFAKCTFANAKLMASPYQPCKFPPVTARYLKVKPLSNNGGYFGRVDIAEWQLLGEFSAATPAQPVAMQQPVTPSRINLISQKNGGSLLLAPNDGWRAANDGEEKSAGNEHVVGAQAVFAFKDEKPATFDTFTVLINASTSNNVKEIELLAGDEGPTGQFRSFAKCTFANAKLMASPYQPCKFPPVTARYLKVKPLSNNGGYFGRVDIAEWQLLGEYSTESSQPAAIAQQNMAQPAPAGQSAVAVQPPVPSAAPIQPAAARLNLISAKNGGVLLLAPNDGWQAANDDAEKPVVNEKGVGAQVVFAFRDEKPATFDTFTVFINASSGDNVKEIELLAGDEGPTGQFRSFAKCTFANAKMMASPYQACKFPAVTARYLKVKPLSNNGGYFGRISIAEWQLLGPAGP